jgi:hypothetical protein
MAYPRALRRLSGYDIRHECTASMVARTTGNPLFPVNLMDLLLRHNSANHKRETIAFSKRHQAALERAALLVLWRNYCKRFSENHDGGTPAMRVGVNAAPWSAKQLLAKRLFPSLVQMPIEWRRYYERRIPTVGIRRARLHQLRLAF